MNHSGKVTCATTLFQSGVDEQLIMRQMGHRSDAVQAYKWSSKEQDVIAGKPVAGVTENASTSTF